MTDPTPEPICRCGHYKSVHTILHPDMPEAVCNAPDCTCMDFIPVDLDDTPVGAALDEWMTTDSLGPGKVFAEWVKAHGGAEQFAHKMAAEIAPQIADMMDHFVHPTGAQQWAMWLWARYFVDCENYDRSVCACTNSEGTALPVSAYERSKCEGNALRQLKRLGSDAETMGLTVEEMKAAKKVVSLLSHSAREAIYRMPPAKDVERNNG